MTLKLQNSPRSSPIPNYSHFTQPAGNLENPAEFPPAVPEGPAFYAPPHSELEAGPAENAGNANGESASETPLHWHNTSAVTGVNTPQAPPPAGAFLSPSAAVTAAAAAAMGLSPTHLAYGLNHESTYHHHQVKPQKILVLFSNLFFNRNVGIHRESRVRMIFQATII